MQNIMPIHTAIYGRQPASLVFAIESTSCPLIPKSHSFMLPDLSNKIFDGFTSANNKQKYKWCAIIYKYKMYLHVTD